MSLPQDSPEAKFPEAKSSVANTPALSCPLHGWSWKGGPLVLAVVVAISLLARVAYFVELSGGPLMVEHHWDQSDMCYFDGWARGIVAGDWLSRNVTPPLHAWHHEVAEDYFRRHPEELDRLRPRAAGMVKEFFGKHPEAQFVLRQAVRTPGTEYYRRHPKELAALGERIVACGLLWEEWMGPKRFYQEPLYPYLIALTYQVAGLDARYVFVWQLLLGVLSNVLIYLIARRYFGEATGALAGVLAALCAPLLYFEMVLLRETLIVFAGLLLVWLAGTAARRRSPRWWLATGAAMGLSLTLKSHFAIFLLGTLVLLAVQCRKSLKDLVWLEAAALLGVALGLTPLVARNVAVGVGPLSLASAGGANFILGNANEPESHVSDFRVQHVAEIIGQTGGRLLPTVAATLETYSNASGYLRVLWEKFEATWHWYELPDNTNFYYYRLHAAILRHLPVTFLILSPLALVGLLLGAKRAADSTSAGAAERAWCAAPHLYLLVLTNLTVPLAFFVRDRYRAPLTAALIPFAALTIVLAAEWLRGRRLARAAAVIGGVVLLAFWTARPLPGHMPLIRLVDCTVPYQLYYGPMEKQAQQAGDYRKAAEIVVDSLRFEPEIVKQLGPGHRAGNAPEAALGQAYANMRYRCAGDYQLAGLREEARREHARADELASASGGRRQ